MFADLMYLFLSSSFLKWMNACVIGFAVTFNPRFFNRHSNFCFRFLQKLFDLRFGCFAVESGYYSLTLILVSMCSPAFVTSVLKLFVYVKDFLFHIHDSFTDLLVSVVFFFHFHNG